MVDSVCFTVGPKMQWDVDPPAVDRIGRGNAVKVWLRSSHAARDKKRKEKKLAEQDGPVCCKCKAGCFNKTCKCLRTGKNCGSDCKCTTAGHTCRNRAPVSNTDAHAASAPSAAGMEHGAQHAPGARAEAEQGQQEQGQPEQEPEHDEHPEHELQEHVHNMTFSDDDGASIGSGHDDLDDQEMHNDADEAVGGELHEEAEPDNTLLPEGVQRSTVYREELRFSLRSTRPGRGATLGYVLEQYGGPLGRQKRPRGS